MVGEQMKRKLENIKGLDNENIMLAIQAVADMAGKALQNGNKIMICGNGGSAADSQHFAAELVGRFKHERAPLPALALHTNTSTLTAIANDYDYSQVFARQVKAFGQPGDILIAISTSGKAQNILEAVKAAKEKKITVVALTGRNTDNPLVEIADTSIRVPGTATADIQECHIIVLHLICENIDNLFANKKQ